jgi:anti-anti-sigma regulatory factor
MRITVMAINERAVTLLVEGRILGSRGAALNDECEAHRAMHRRITLDLSGVTFVDAAGVELLQTLARDRVALVGCSIFVVGLLSARPRTRMRKECP